jgi:hypothetical protein
VPGLPIGLVGVLGRLDPSRRVNRAVRISHRKRGLRLDVWQYGYWHGRKKFTVLGEEGDNVNRVDRIDRGTWYECLASVGAGDPVWVKVTFEVYALASGGGSFAELNLAEGRRELSRAHRADRRTLVVTREGWLRALHTRSGPLRRVRCALSARHRPPDASLAGTSRPP